MKNSLSIINVKFDFKYMLYFCKTIFKDNNFEFWHYVPKYTFYNSKTTSTYSNFNLGTYQLNISYSLIKKKSVYNLKKVCIATVCS